MLHGLGVILSVLCLVLEQNFRRDSDSVVNKSQKSRSLFLPYTNSTRFLVICIFLHSIPSLFNISILNFITPFSFTSISPFPTASTVYHSRSFFPYFTLTVFILLVASAKISFIFSPVLSPSLPWILLH